VGELRYPNGIVAASFPAAAREAVSAHAPRTAILVVERDNHRVQAFWADTRESAGVFGERELVAPYGAAVSHQGSAVVLYVTDPNAAPERRGQIFELRVRDAAIEAVRRGGFGERDGAGRMGDVESVVVDDALRRVYVCDEDARHVKVFELDGRFSGRTVGDGLVRGDPEGLVLCAAADGRYLVLTDQRKEQTVWHAFAADNLRHVGSWTGAPSTRNTDGVAILQQPLAGFPHGVFVAVNDDRDIHAYRVEDILHALRLQPAKDPP
jgi:3-phytase